MVTPPPAHDAAAIARALEARFKWAGQGLPETLEEIHQQALWRNRHRTPRLRASLAQSKGEE